MTCRYAGRTVVLNQYYPGRIHDINDVDLSPGHTYTLSLRALDAAGNASAPAQLLFETTPPEPPTTLQQLTTHRITNSDGTFADYPDVVSFDPGRDDAGPVRVYEVVVDGRALLPLLSGQMTQFSVFRYVFDCYCMSPMGHTTVQVRAYDASLNRSQLSEPLTVFLPEH